jgi:hypothetical protein
MIIHGMEAGRPLGILSQAQLMVVQKFLFNIAYQLPLPHFLPHHVLSLVT